MRGFRAVWCAVLGRFGARFWSGLVRGLGRFGARFWGGLVRGFDFFYIFLCPNHTILLLHLTQNSFSLPKPYNPYVVFAPNRHIIPLNQTPLKILWSGTKFLNLNQIDPQILMV